MTRDDTLKLMSLLKIAYPAYYRDMRRKDANHTVDLWAEMLAPYPLELVLVATKRLIAESKFAPAIAEVIERIREYITPETDNAGAAWKALRAAAERATVLRPGEWEALPEEVREFVGSRSGLVSLGNLDESTLDTVTRGQFAKVYPALRRRREFRESMSPELRQLTQSLTRQLNPPKPQPRQLAAPPSPPPTQDKPEDAAEPDVEFSVADLLKLMAPKPEEAAPEPLDDAEWEQLRDDRLAQLGATLAEKGAVPQ